MSTKASVIHLPAKHKIAFPFLQVFSKKETEDKMNGELLRRLRNDAKMIRQDSKTSFINSVEGLTRNQLKAALLHLIEVG